MRRVFPIRMPALRERGDDVLLLAQAFARRLAAQRGSTAAPLSPADCARLKRYDWPGNVRELSNVIERAWITSHDGRTLNLDRALPDASDPPDRSDPLAAAAPPPVDAGDRVLTAAELAEIERANLRRALARSGGKISGAGGAAELLGIPPNTLSSRLKSLGIERPRPR